MKRAFCLDLDTDTYSLGDLNMWMSNPGDIRYRDIDPMDPARPFFTGAFEESVQVGDRIRRFLIYIPEAYPISGAGLFLFADDGLSCADCLQDGWKERAEKYQTALIILESDEGGWSRIDIQKEMDFAEAVFKRSIARDRFSMNEATYYIMGTGAGAYPAAAYALLNSSLFAALLADGDYELHEDLLRQLSGIRSDRDRTRSKLEVVLPAWFSTGTDTKEGKTVECLKAASQVEDRGLSDQGTRVYLQDVRRCRATPDGYPISEIRFTGREEREKTDPQALYDRMLAFALRFKRWLSTGNGELRPARSWSDMGLKRQTAVVDGRRREWYIYEPSAYRADPSAKLPLLVAIHGFSCSGAIFAENTEWHAVAEKRGFLLVYVSAFPSNLVTKGTTVPLPTWNTPGMPSDPDDLKFILSVVDRIEEEYPVDRERIYVSGHSNGSMMTQYLMQMYPQRFAAFAPQGAPYHFDLQRDKGMCGEREIPADGICRPVWLMMGSEDIADQDRVEPGNLNDLFIRMMCRVNGLDGREPDRYENGKYHTMTYTDQAGIPLVRFTGIADTPHCITPEMCFMYWDQFLSHFRRKADGGIEYIL